MGRKIPAKKHRGVKDPLLQQAKRLETLKGKINAPPKDPDEQPIPRSLITLFGLEDKKKKNIATNKSRTVKVHGKAGSCANANPVQRMRRAAGESGRDFSLRINTAVKTLHNPTEHLHYPLDLESEDVKGQRMAEQRERRARKRRRAGQPADGGHGERLTRTQKLALKNKAKKLKALESRAERQELRYERVPFGEVCAAPPALPPLRSRLAPQAAGRRELLLSRLLAPPAERARLDAIAAYRALKNAPRGNK